MFRFLLTFGVIHVVLLVGETIDWAHQHIVNPLTAGLAVVSAAILQTIHHDVIARGVDILSATTGQGVRVMPGCNGIEACITLIAAMCAFPAPWGYRLRGILLGILAVQLLNVLRVISLYWLLHWDMDVFRFAHLYAWQCLIMLDVLVVWLIWVRRIPGRALLLQAAA